MVFIYPKYCCVYHFTILYLDLLKMICEYIPNGESTWRIYWTYVLFEVYEIQILSDEHLRIFKRFAMIILMWVVVDHDPPIAWDGSAVWRCFIRWDRACI